MGKIKVLFDASPLSKNILAKFTRIPRIKIIKNLVFMAAHLLYNMPLF